MDTPRFPPLPAPVLPAERYHLRPLLDRAAAEARVRAAVSEGAFRPADAAGAARIDDLSSLLVPFWRLDVTRTDDTITLRQGKIGSIDIPIPGTRTHDARATWMVCARSAFPYEMKKAGALLKWDVEPLVVSLAALIPGDPPATPGWERLDADVDPDQARRRARDALKSMQHGDEVVTATEFAVHASHFVVYPVWLARYHCKRAWPRRTAAPTTQGSRPSTARSSPPATRRGSGPGWPS